MSIRWIQGFGIQRFDGLSMVNLKPSKPYLSIVSNLQTFISSNLPNLISRVYGYMGYRGIEGLFGIPRRFAAVGAGERVYRDTKPSIYKPSYRIYIGYESYGGLMV